MRLCAVLQPVSPSSGPVESLHRNVFNVSGVNAVPAFCVL